jgi:hypothetical protein
MKTSGTDNLRALGQLLIGAPPTPGSNWKTLIDLARRHAVSPLLFWRLRERQIPEAGLLEELHREYYAAAVRGMVVGRHLAQVLGTLAAAGVPALVLKGSAAAAFYPDPALRPYGDLDILVSQDQVHQAEAALNRLGYARLRPKEWKLAYGYDLPLMSRDGRPAVEIHWRLGYPEAAGHLPAEEVWARAVPWMVDGQEALRLEAVDAALHLCAHALVKHRSRLGIRPLCDLALIADGWGQPEWRALAQRAAEYGLARPVYLMLTLAERALGLAVPAEAMAALRPSGGGPFPEDLVRRLLDLDREKKVRVPIAAVRAGARGTRWVAVRHFLWHMFLPRQGMAFKYNVAADSPRIWLTYLWRPVDLLRRYGKVAWKALRGDPVARAVWEHEAWLERWLREEAET